MARKKIALPHTQTVLSVVVFLLAEQRRRQHGRKRGVDRWLKEASKVLAHETNPLTPTGFALHVAARLIRGRRH